MSAHHLDDLALTGGRWVNVRGVQRWVADPTWIAPRTAICGTDSGYYRHRRKLREDACSRCKAAHSLVTQRQRAARKAAA